MHEREHFLPDSFQLDIVIPPILIPYIIIPPLILTVLTLLSNRLTLFQTTDAARASTFRIHSANIFCLNRFNQTLLSHQWALILTVLALLSYRLTLFSNYRCNQGVFNPMTCSNVSFMLLNFCQFVHSLTYHFLHDTFQLDSVILKIDTSLDGISSRIIPYSV